MAKIVIIEDEEDIRELVLYSLKSNQLEGLGFASGQEFFKADLAEGKIDLILLDVMLPDEDGLQILAKLRSDHRYEDLPIIMLTARSSEMDKVKALDLGADDYVVKPFGILELISRINARLRRSKSNDLLVFNEITIDQSRYEVKVNNQLIELPNKEYELLLYLMKNQNLLVSRDSLLLKIWGYDYEGESRTLDIHISNLRKNLGDYAGYIQTVRGQGFKLGSKNA